MLLGFVVGLQFGVDEDDVLNGHRDGNILKIDASPAVHNRESHPAVDALPLDEREGIATPRLHVWRGKCWQR